MDANANADMITCDTATGVPLFAHHVDVSPWDFLPSRYSVSWAREPDNELRKKEESVRLRMMFAEINDEVEFKRIPEEL
jgi:hypothetical protein